jgi:hypothetical protein
MDKKSFFTSGQRSTVVLLFLLFFVLLGPHFTQASGKRNGNKAFDPESLNIESVKNDEEFADLLPEYSIQFTGLVDREMETTFSTIVRELSEAVIEGYLSDCGSGTRGTGAGVQMCGWIFHEYHR